MDHMDVSENNGTPKSSILIGFSIKNHPFWGTSIFGNPHITTPERFFQGPTWMPPMFFFIPSSKGAILELPCFDQPILAYMGVSKNRGKPPKWMVYKENPYENG